MPNTMEERAWVAGEAIAHAVNVATELRQAFDQPGLTDLPPARPADGKECLLAKAFNFDCVVGLMPRPNVPGRWAVAFPSEEHAKKLAEVLGVEVWEVLMHLDGVRHWVAGPLPSDLVLLAKAFDRDDGVIERRYYQIEGD